MRAKGARARVSRAGRGRTLSAGTSENSRRLTSALWSLAGSGSTATCSRNGGRSPWVVR
jgi:hypothetical protein